MKLNHLYRDQCGGALVEFTVVFPVFVSLTFGIVQAGLMLWAQVGLQHGVEMAARCASLSDVAIKYADLKPTTNPTPCYSTNSDATGNASTVKSFAASNSWGLNPPASAFSVAYNSGTCLGGNLVTATYSFTAITYLFSKTLTAQSCYPTSAP
jgi:Flp pilus assembly protein TadG